MTFSPLEVAKASPMGVRANDQLLMKRKAFRSPLFDNCHSNSSGRDIAREAGGLQLRYGVVKTEDGRSMQAFAGPDSLERPQSGGFEEV